MSADALFRQVHTLALHYHWSQGEILGLTRTCRLRYLALLEEHLDALRGAER
ncbi:MAG TPA: hypothetical protein VEW03_04930 [Longimicrobiaceae bacterium]|nr:hypothetical protein [Longimicrobiaceae bacterium]